MKIRLYIDSRGIIADPISISGTPMVGIGKNHLEAIGQILFYYSDEKARKNDFAGRNPDLFSDGLTIEHGICTCECHGNKNIRHCTPCCDLCGQQYLDNDLRKYVNNFVDYAKAWKLKYEN